MAANISKEDLAAFNEALADTYAAFDTVRNKLDEARDNVERLKTVARRVYDPSTAASIFNGVLSDADLANRATADAINGLPAIDEGEQQEL